MISSTDFNKIFGRNLRRVMAEQDVKRFFWRAVVKEIKFGADKSIGIVFND